MRNLFTYIILIIAGLLLILLCSIMQKVAPSQYPEYYYSLFLARNYTVLTAVIFFMAGLLIGYYFRLNPWLSGMCLILIIPIASFYEIAVDLSSHNLLPFELIIYFVFALPPTIGVYLGRFVFERMKKTKG
jgi:hypothetical protein